MIWFKVFRMENLSEDFCRVDQSRARPVKKVVAIGQKHGSVADCSQLIPVRVPGEHADFLLSPLQIESAG